MLRLMLMYRSNTSSFSQMRRDNHKSSKEGNNKCRMMRGAITRDTNHKCISSDNVKHGDSQQFLWIISACFLENFCCNWHSGVNRITDQVDNSTGAAFGYSFTECPHNSSINIEKIISCHPRLPWNTSRNDHQIHTCKGILELLLPEKTPHLQNQNHNFSIKKKILLNPMINS